MNLIRRYLCTGTYSANYNIFDPLWEFSELTENQSLVSDNPRIIYCIASVYEKECGGHTYRYVYVNNKIICYSERCMEK